MTFDHDLATELLNQLAADDPNCHFAAEQKQSISEVAISALSDGHETAAPANRVVNKEQKHDWIFNYFPEILWSVLRSVMRCPSASDTAGMKPSNGKSWEFACQGLMTQYAR